MKIANLGSCFGNMRYNKREYKRKNHKLTCETRGQKDGKIIAGLVQMDSGPDMNENMRMAEQYVREAAEQERS